MCSSASSWKVVHLFTAGFVIDHGSWREGGRPLGAYDDDRADKEDTSDSVSLISLWPSRFTPVQLV